MFDIIVIGAGPSGMTAALYALRSNKSVLIIEKESFGGQIANSPKVENYPSIKEISGTELGSEMFDQIEALGVKFELDEITSVKKIDGGFKVNGNFSSYEAKSIIIANGVKHRTLGLPHEEELTGNGLYYCAVCDGPMYKDQDIYLIGDANSALQYALLLAGYAKHVHMFTLFGGFFGEKILQDKVNANEKITVLNNMNCVEYLGEDELTGLVFENTQTKERFEYKTNNLFVAIGQVPQNDLFKDFVELDKGFIVTDDEMKTKTPGIFACGDTRKKAVRQVVTACNDGAIAAMSAVKYLA